MVSTDEMTAIQALERTHPTLPMKPRLVERIEFEYIRHGTQSLIANWHIAKGRVINPLTLDQLVLKKILLPTLLKLSTPTRKLGGFSLLTN